MSSFFIRRPIFAIVISIIIVIVGGVIPAQDYDELYRDGAAAIFGPGTPIATAAIKIMEILLDEQK
jgi:methylmalonyl-CoA mutase